MGENASVVTRFIALVIDGIILAVIGGILAALTGRAELGSIASFVVGVLYQIYFLTSQNGQTPGKRIMGIRVVKTSGAPLTAADAIIRYIGYYINTIVIFLGWIWALIDSNHQGWHDKIAGTYVVSA